MKSSAQFSLFSWSDLGCRRWVTSRLKIVLSLLLVASVFAGCETPEQSALAGAGAGAAAGALLKGNGRGALQGAAIGGLGGYALGKFGEGERAKGYVAGQNSYGYQAPPPPPAPVYVPAEPVYVAPPAYEEPRYHHHSRPAILVARPSGRYGFVYSPYTGELVDVRRIPRGAEVADPRTGRVFINP